LSTIVHPVAIAGPTLHTIWLIGQFHGVIRPHTPIGSATRCSLGLAGEDHRGTHLVRDGRRDLVVVSLVDLEDSFQQVASFLDRGSRKVIKRIACCGRRAIDVRRGSERDPADRLLAGRVDDVEVMTLDRIDPLSSDVELSKLVHRHIPGQSQPNMPPVSMA
jgi:hypothetical protein